MKGPVVGNLESPSPGEQVGAAMVAGKKAARVARTVVDFIFAVLRLVFIDLSCD